MNLFEVMVPLRGNAGMGQWYFPEMGRFPWEMCDFSMDPNWYPVALSLWQLTDVFWSNSRLVFLGLSLKAPGLSLKTSATIYSLRISDTTVAYTREDVIGISRCKVPFFLVYYTHKYTVCIYVLLCTWK